ncbi:hypothetical protein [Rhizobium sp. Leaf386]|uniref:hypothetical protein n=1 Tax=Rhizobium sp. Leaf386 TaxID=1736359 RepID=UPI0007147DBE|nr:hypothetical protein [Rhizobium sp. Leaf386]KQS90334.1 hypothetical protein ASG50_07720 [Rhizobium sp. Leaf386]
MTDLYYAKGREIWKSPVRTKIEGGESVSLGFHACTASEVVGDEGAVAIAALLCLGEKAQIPAPATIVMGIKPLEWADGAPGTYTEIAKSLFGHYSVWEINGTACWAPWKDGAGSIVEGGIVGAKAAAQADYEQRIASALIPVPASQMVGWHDIATAPKDGTEILLFTQWAGDEACPAFSKVQIGSWDDGNDLDPTHDFYRLADWSLQYVGTPVRWMPLPAAPVLSAPATEVEQ